MKKILPLISIILLFFCSKSESTNPNSTLDINPNQIKTLFVLFICLNVMCQEPIEPDWKDLNYAGNEQGYHTCLLYTSDAADE